MFCATCLQVFLYSCEPQHSYNMWRVYYGKEQTLPYAHLSRRALLREGGRLAVSLPLASVLAACQSGPTVVSRTGPLNVDAVAGTINAWLAAEDPTLDEYLFSNDIAPFEQKYPKVNVNAIYKPANTFHQQTQTALVARKGPDIIVAAGPSAGVRYAESGYLLNLDDYAREFKWQEKVQPWALEVGKYAGKLYTLPFRYQSLFLFYNKTLFESNGWKVPTNRTELDQLCEAMMGKGVVPFSAGNGDDRLVTEWWTTAFLNHYAGPEAMYQALTGKLSWTDPVFVEAVALLNSYVQKGWFGGGVKQYFTNSISQMDARFASGKFGMAIWGSWGFSQFSGVFGQEGNTNEFSWAPIPPLREGVPENMYVLGVGDTRSVNAFTQAPDACALYLDWLYSTPDRIFKEIAEQNITPPPIYLDTKKIPTDADKLFAESVTALNNAASSGNFGYTTWTFWPPKAQWVAYDGMDRVFAGYITPAQFCAEHDETFKQELASGNVPTAPKGKI